MNSRSAARAGPDHDHVVDGSAALNLEQVYHCSFSENWIWRSLREVESTPKSGLPSVCPGLPYGVLAPPKNGVFVMLNASARNRSPTGSRMMNRFDSATS